MSHPQLSIVTSVYNSENFIESFLTKLTEAINQIDLDTYEIIVVDDGSPDNSVVVVGKMMKTISSIRLVRLSRNFGHHNAFMAGMTVSSGKLVFNIDSDLETDPNELVRFWAKFHESEADVIYGYQEKRKGGWFERVSGQLFWKFLAILSKLDIPPNITTERLMSRRYVDELIKLQESSPFLGGLMYWVGFKQVGIPIKRVQRKQKSSYSIRKRIDLLTEAITAFSGYPLRLVFNTGLSITTLSLLGLIYLVLRKVFFPESIVLGYTSIVAFVILSLGIIMLSIGIIGIYLEKIFLQTKGRPNFIIDKIEEN